jgi:hypothetical protein
MPVIIPIPVDVYTRESHLDWTEALACCRCGRQCHARVAVVGRGEASTAYKVGRERAHANAGIDAFSRASGLGRTLCRLAKCPSCNGRLTKDWGLTWIAWGTAFVGAFFGPPLATGPLVALGIIKPDSVVRLALGLLALPATFGAILYAFRARKLSQADRRVRCESAFEVSQDLVDAARSRLQGHTAPAPLSRPRPVPQGRAEAGRRTEQSSGGSDDLELDFDRTWNKP